MNEQFKQILEKFNQNPYSLTRDETTYLQKQMGFVENGKDHNKLDGWMGTDTIKAVQRYVGIKDDGIWGKNSKASYNTFKTRPTDSWKSYLPTWGNKDNNKTETNTDHPYKHDMDLYGETVEYTPEELYNFGKVAAKWAVKTDDKKPVTTSDKLADENIEKYTNYVTQDMGHDVSYNRGSIKYEKTDFDQTFINTKKQFEKESSAPFPGLGTPYAPEYQGDTQPWQWSFVDYLEDGFNVKYNSNVVRDYFENQRKKGKAFLDVQTTTLKGNPEYTQTHLSNSDRKDWSTELGLRAKYIAELDTLRAEQDVNANNAMFPENKSEYERNSQIYQDRMGLSTNTPRIKYIGERKAHNTYPTQYQDLITEIETNASKTGNLNLTDEQQKNLQYYYDTYGISPQYKFLPQREVELLDHLHAAGYNYDSKPKTFSDATSKISDAMQGKFTHRTYDGNAGTQSTFTFANLTRAGLTNHLNNRGENIGNKFNKELFNEKAFKFSPTLSYNWDNKSYNVSLQETNPRSDYDLYVNRLKPVYNDLINLQDSDVERMNEKLKSLGFRDPDAIKYKKQLTTWRPSLQDFESGKRTAGHFTTTQSSGMGQPHYGAGRIQGIQMIDGIPQWFDQDLYDVGEPGMYTIGSSTYYKTPHKMTPDQINTTYQYFIKGEEE